MSALEQFHRELLLASGEDPVSAGRRIVTGEGKQDRPRIMLIGEAPGAQEEEAGRPFVGKAGKNLDGFLQRLELDREELWISNVVKIRPFKLSAKGTRSNRTPNRQELSFFTPWLHREIGLIGPELLVTLGNTALHALTGEKTVIGDVHGRPMETALGMLFPLYHPASIIYNRALSAVWDEDLAALKEYLR